MREISKADGIEIQLIGGTYVVLIGMSVSPSKVKGLLGFAIERTDHTKAEGFHPTAAASIEI